MKSEDRRTVKTKRNLKETLIKLLTSTSFERVSVTELCKAGDTSRITFYTHYEDKYALAEELFQDFVDEAIADYYRLQAANNPEKKALQGYYNMLDCILNLYYNHVEPFSKMSLEKNSFLYSSFYYRVVHNVENYVERHRPYITPKYSAHQTAVLLCNGLLGVITECYDRNTPREKLRNDAMDMYRDILNSELFHIVDK